MPHLVRQQPLKIPQRPVSSFTGSALISGQHREQLGALGRVSLPWFYNGLLWPTVNGQIIGSIPIGAIDYPSLLTYLAAPDFSWPMVPASAYAGAVCSYSDLPMKQQGDALAMVYSRWSMAAHAKTILLQVWAATGIGLKTVPPLT